MASKQILICRTHLTVQIYHLDFKNRKLTRLHGRVGANVLILVYLSLYIYIYIYVYIYIYEMGYGELRSKATILLHTHILRFENSNDRSELLNMISILKCAWRPNFTFFGIFLLFIKPLWKLPIQRSRNFYCLPEFSDFQSSLINSKKIPKNVKFSFQAYFNIN